MTIEGVIAMIREYAPHGRIPERRHHAEWLLAAMISLRDSPFTSSRLREACKREISSWLEGAQGP